MSAKFKLKKIVFREVLLQVQRKVTIFAKSSLSKIKIKG